VEGVTTIRNRIEFIPVNCPRWRGVTVNHYAVGSNPTTGANNGRLIALGATSS
jgi:hypothetical protein